MTGTVIENADKRGKLSRWWNIWVVGGVDHEAVIKQIGEESGWTGRYAFLIVISAALSLLGVLMPSVAVLIGAMLLSPLMLPIIGLGFGIATMDFEEIRRSAVALAAGSIIAIVLCAILVAMSPVQTITSEIAGRTRPTLFDLLVALLSAIAGAYALIRGRGNTVVGVAIAIALMPPLAVVGFGIATWNWTVFSGSLLLFLTNAVTIALTAALVARLYGFGSHLSPHHTGWQIVLFVVSLGLLSVPLGAALRQIAFEAVAQRTARDAALSHFPGGSRLSQIELDYSTDPLRVRGIILTPRLDPQADRVLAAQLRDRLQRPVDVHFDQLTVPDGAGQAEAAQIARAAESGPASRSDNRHRAVERLALVSGADPRSIAWDDERRVLRAAIPPMPGLTLLGYRAIEDRARRSIPEWQIMLTPPANMDLPEITIDQGVVDSGGLDLAAWFAQRQSRVIVVQGGTRPQREAIAQSIVARGAQARAGDLGGTLRFEWQEVLEVPETRQRPPG